MTDNSPPRGRRRRGRPRGGSTDARERILAAATEEFAATGYDRTTMRAIAERAEVDAALLHHYFGTKSDLFAATVDVPLNPARLLSGALDGELSDAGDRLVRFVVRVWDDPSFRARGVALLRAAIGSGRMGTTVTGFVTREILHRLGDRIGGADAELRAGLVASQVVGLIVTRYVLEFPPLATATPDEVADTVGPTLQRYLTGELS